MRRFLFFINLLFFSVLCFTQEAAVFKISGRIPSAENSKLYRIQVGSFKNIQNAEKVFARLGSASLNPVYDKYLDLTRVIVTGISAGDIARILNKIQMTGFHEVWITEDSAVLPTSTAVLPPVSLRETGFRTVKVGETRNIADLAGNTNTAQWVNSTPSLFTIEPNGDVKGISIGSGFININGNEYISIAVVPAESFYTVSDSLAALLPPGSRTGNSSRDIPEYRTEPTFRLAYRFNNNTEFKGASGRNGGIDIIARGGNYEWLWTTYEQGGWFYRLKRHKT
jgi:hypothetical protein